MRHHGEVVAEIPNRELADEAPLYDRPHTRAAARAPLDARADFRRRRSAATTCSRLLAVARPLFQALDLGAVRLHGPHQHDRRARARDAAIVRIKETGTSIAMSLDGNGRYCYLDPARRREAGGGRVLPQSRHRGRACRWPPPTI